MKSIEAKHFQMPSTTSALHFTEKQRVARKTTFVSIALNTVLMSVQIVIGVFAHSQALVADGIHSLADLVSDFVVLIANRHSSAAADTDHNYGHSRYETVASLFLGALLIAVGIGMLWRAGTRLADMTHIPAVHLSALAVAVVVLVSKEALFRYMLHEAQRVRSAMLIANAWHARSDAASSLVVALGIVGSLAGVRLLDPIAAAIVGFMVARMGWAFGWDALQDLSDRALDEAATADVRALLMATPGVRDVHELRTRKMGDYALIDAHVLVDPMISVSEGHYIAESARALVLKNDHVLDALIHVDPENDAIAQTPMNLPPRAKIVAEIDAALADVGLKAATVNLHYLSTGLAIDVTLQADESESRDSDAQRLKLVDFDSLKRKVDARRLSVQRAVAVSTAGAKSELERAHDHADEPADAGERATTPDADRLN